MIFTFNRNVSAKDAIVPEYGGVGEIGEDVIVGGTTPDASMTVEIAAGMLIATVAKMILLRLRPMLEAEFVNFVFHVTCDIEIKRSRNQQVA